MLSLRSLYEKIDDYMNQGKSLQICSSEKKMQEMIVANLLYKLCNNKLSDKLILVLPTQKDCYNWYDFLSFYRNKIKSLRFNLDLLEPITLYGQGRFSNKTEAKQRRMSSLFALQDDSKSLVITTVQAFLQKVVPVSKFQDYTIGIHRGLEFPQEELFSKLSMIGYHQVSSVHEKATFSCRGSIVDIFSVHLDHPVRIEFFGDRISSIRCFQIKDQRSFHHLEQIVVTPAIDLMFSTEERKANLQRVHEYLLSQNINRYDIRAMEENFLQGNYFEDMDVMLPVLEEKLDSVASYIKGNSVFVFPQSIQKCLDHYGKYVSSVEQLLSKDRECKRVTADLNHHFDYSSAFLTNIKSYPLLEMGNPFSSKNMEQIVLRDDYKLDLDFHIGNKEKSVDWWLQYINDNDNQQKIIILVPSKDDKKRLVNVISSREIKHLVVEDIQLSFCKEVKPNDVVIIGYGYLDSVVYDKTEDMIVIPSHVFFNSKRKAIREAIGASSDLSLMDMKKEDLLVHKDHGVGRFIGVICLSLHGVEKDFVKIEYKGANYIYLPVDKLNLISKYHQGKGGALLDKLGGTSWGQKKAKIKRKVQIIAQDLLNLQAKRNLLKSHRYGQPSSFYYDLVDDFPYQETDDQLKCLRDIEKDLQSSKPMDRLIVGDVGFGKTEIAIRAAMRSVLEGFQVMMLVPTTVLSYQHYLGFKDRFEKYGVAVAHLNRSLKKANRERIIRDFNEGKIDLLIGTHLLLSKDLKPRKLGLVVIDEEHKFGVVHKEKIKEMSIHCNLLTMTATPIPRTLNMSQLGIKDLSILKTPPRGRLPIETYVAQFDENLIRDAVQKEIQRNGQVFFVHNKIDDLPKIKSQLEQLIPGLKVLVIHGQLRESLCSSLLMSFIEKKYQLLLCTTVIESGVDIPNANTIIVSMGENYGLSQMHQLRGRVGRSTVQSYAYFLCGNKDVVVGQAQKRLEVISSLSNIGCGHQIANYDMEIRGVGNLLGIEQTGDVSTVGVDFYMEMLTHAVEKIRNKGHVGEQVDPEIKLLSTIRIPSNYISEENERLSIYRKLFFASSREEITVLLQDIADKYGPIPNCLRSIAYVSLIKTFLSKIEATSLVEVKVGCIYELSFGRQYNRFRNLIEGIVVGNSISYHFTSDHCLRILLEKKDPAGDYYETLDTLASYLEALYLNIQ